MNCFQLEIPTTIYYGRSNIENVLKHQAEWMRGNVLIVSTGGALIRNGYIEQLERLMQSMQYIDKVIVNCEISSNPKLSDINSMIQQGIRDKIDMVVGFGGGSSIDAAKAVAVGIGNRKSIDDFFFKGIEPSEKTLPIIAIPTTAGTGSELSKAAIITDEVRKKKGGIRGKYLYPKVAIVDSRYTDTVPYQITMETGFDVLAHAVESYISKKATPFTEMLSEKVIQIVGDNLPKLNNNLEDKEARDQMSYASMLMGINLGNASTCLPHRMQYPIGAHTGTSHGIGLAALFPAWIYYEYAYAQEKMEKVIFLLKKEKVNSKEEVIELVEEFLMALHLHTNLRQLGVKQEELSQLEAEVTGSIEHDPASVEKQIINKIYHMAY